MPDSRWWAGVHGPVHARRAENALALCGAVPGADRSTTKRSQVTCPRCLVEIERRLEARRARR